MWNGQIEPSLVKKLSEKEVSFDPENTDNLDGDPESIEGTLTITLDGKDYSWNGVTYADYLDFEASDFSRSWMNDNLPIDYVGDWGWPWGRDHSSVAYVPDKKHLGKFRWVTVRRS